MTRNLYKDAADSLSKVLHIAEVLQQRSFEMERKMIRLNNICKSFNGKRILDNINISFKTGEITFIVGTSGAGKTTLLNIIGGLDRPTSGNVVFDGRNIGEDLNEYRAKNIGFVFQDFNLIPGLSVVQNIEIATEISGIKKNMDEIISEVNALGIADPYQRVETLSGGEKQRVAIIRSICKDADILIADEPTGSLDSNNADLVLDMLQSIKDDKHIIIVSHDMEKAKKYADRIVTIRDGNIVSDEIIANECQSILNRNNKADSPVCDKSSMLHTIFILGRNSVRKRLSKIISIALVIALSIASLATVININELGSALTHNVNVNYLENDLMNLYYDVTPNTSRMEYPFTEDDIQNVKNEYDIKETVLIYLADNHDWFFTSESQMSDACLKQINIDDFFEERVLSNDIEGEFIAGNNEIIVAEDVAEELFGGDCIGKNVTLNNGEGYSIDYTIVGINHTKNPSDEFYSFVSAESLKILLADIMDENLYNRQILSPFYTEIHSMTTGGIYGSMNPLDNKEDLLYGNYPSSNEEVIISSALLLNVFGEFDIDKNYSADEITSGEITSADIDKIFSKKFALNFNGIFTVYISGIYLSDDIEIRFTDELITEMQIVDPIGIDVYAANPEQVTEMRDSINEKYAFNADIQLDTLKNNISNQTKFFSTALILLGIVLLCISGALLSSFSKIAVLERKKEVAVIKSLGADNRSVLFILLFDSAVISVISFFISLIVFAAFKFVLPYILSNIEIISLGFPIGLILLISVIFSLLIFLQTSLSLRKLVKQMPAELFAQ